MLNYIAARLHPRLWPQDRSLPKDFHFCRLFAGDDFHLSLTRHEHYLCSMLGLKPGMSVLNVGSGIGDIAVELVRYADVTVVGVDFNCDKVTTPYPMFHIFYDTS